MVAKCNAIVMLVLGRVNVSNNVLVDKRDPYCTTSFVGEPLETILAVVSIFNLGYN